MIGLNNHYVARISAAVLLLAVAPIFAKTAYASDWYSPKSQAEWDGWPIVCKVRYTVSLEGRSSAYANSFPPDTVQRWADRYGDCWGMLHHHCAGILWLQRAQQTPSKQERQNALLYALEQNESSQKRCSKSNRQFSVALTHMGMVYTEAREFAKAKQEFDEALGLHPDYDGAYIAKGIMLKRSGKPEESLATLVAGSAATQGSSAELEYALGLAYFNSNQFEKAREHARRAYALGYPLPSLKDKLASVGFSL
jgi:tetratricopeptide (TPR) repeat protein